MPSIAVFCGSSKAVPSAYLAAARDLGRRIARAHWTLVYGGASVGTMGVLASAALEAGGHVVGALPRFMQQREVAHLGLAELVICDSMHERKAWMSARADAFVVLPGGFGTLDETFEVLTWRQIGLHSKPVVLVDVDGFYSSIREWITRAIDVGYVRPNDARLLTFARTPASAITAVRKHLAAPPPQVEPIEKKWYG